MKPLAACLESLAMFSLNVTEHLCIEEAQRHMYTALWSSSTGHGTPNATVVIIAGPRTFDQRVELVNNAIRL